MNRIFAIVKKDIAQISRNKFIAVISFLAIFVYALIYFLLPSEIDEGFKIGLYLETGREVVEEQLAEEEGLEIKWADSENELKKIIEDKEAEVGFSFVFDAKPVVKLYFSSETPEEIKEAGGTVGREFAYNLLGYQLPIETEEIVIGPDMLGQQIPLRDKIRLLFLIIIPLVEIYALSNLLVDEIQRKTVMALLVTPVSVLDFMSAKAITGILLAFSESLFAALLLKILNLDVLFPLIVFLFLGSVLATGVSFIIGAFSRDFVAAAMWGMPFLLILIIPALPLIFPAAFSPWLKAIPTYYMIEALDGIVNYNISFSQYISQVVYLILFSFFFFAAGFLILKRRLL